MTFIVPYLRHHLEERMSRKLSLVTLALGAMLLAVPAVAQQPDTTKTTTTAKQRKHHRKPKPAAQPAATDTTKK